MIPVFYLPGILGTELHYSLPPSQTYWIDEEQLKKNLVADLTLDGTVGIFPAAGAKALTPGAPLDSHYGKAIRTLRADLEDTGQAKIIPYGYDWRYSVIYTAGFLAADIGRAATPTSPAVLIGHSMGGLVARMAYSLLAQAGKGNLVKRIITLGTPHRGSARIINALNADFGEGIGQVFHSGLLFTLPLSGLVVQMARQRIMNAIGSWPGFYEMLPMVEENGTDADKERKRAFLPESYGGGGTLYKALFDNAKNVTHPALRDGASIPPGKKLVCVVGTGFPTPFVTDPFVAPPEWVQLVPQLPLAIASDGAGDGTVTERSAYVPGSELITVECEHYGLPDFMTRDNLLNQLITEDIDPGNVTPPAPQRPTQQDAPVVVGWPLQPPPPPEPPPPRPKRGFTGRGRPVRR